MKNIRKTKKNIIKILFSLILILFVIITILNLVSSDKNYKEKLEYINSNEWNNERYPDHMSMLFQSYEGKLTAQNMGKSVYYVANEVFPKYYQELRGSDEKKIGKYYDKNIDSILLNIGDINKEQFISLIKEITKLNVETIEFETYNIDIDSIVKKNDYITAKLNIKYLNTEEISVNIRILNYFKDEVSSIKYYK